MNGKAILSAIALSLTAGAALAQGVTPGTRQLELQAGVQSGVYSLPQLIRLLEAQENSEDDTVAFILANPEGEADVARGAARATALSNTAPGAVSPGVAQLAAQAGVAPGLYSHDQLIRLIAAQQENQDDVVRFILADPQGPLAG